MQLDFSIVESFVNEHRLEMHDRTLLRHNRYRILSLLREKLWNSLREYEIFEAELSVLLDTIGTCNDFDDLRKYHDTAVTGLKNYFLEEHSIVDLHDLFRVVRDRLTERVLALVEEELKSDGSGPPPVPYCWIALGSEGRDEQTFFTDQDNMIVWMDVGGPAGSEKQIEGADNHPPPAVYFQEFSNRTVERLHQVGFNKCKGGIMPSNEKWRGSLSDWQKKIEDTLARATGVLELLDLIILIDARLMKGERLLFDTTLGRLFSLLKQNNHMMKELAESAILMPTALGFFGKFKVEASGVNKGRFNIKLFGWSPLIMSVRVLALHAGVRETNTLRRIKTLRQQNVISKETEQELTDAYLLFVKFRVTNQLEPPKNGDMSYIDPEMLGSEDAAKLRKAMRSVEAFQKYLNEIVLFGQPL